MKKYTLSISTPEERIQSAITEAYNIYINRLITGYYEIGLEATFQLYFASILEKVLETKVLFITEHFSVILEKNFPINGIKDYVDIAVQYESSSNEKEVYLIELKFKKRTDSAPNLGNISSYIDIYTLSQLKKQQVCNGAFYIFLTDYETYTRASQKGLRLELPMHDGAHIQNNITYSVSGNAAKKACKKYVNGFLFENSYDIEYTKFDIKGKPYWYYILKI